MRRPLAHLVGALLICSALASGSGAQKVSSSTTAQDARSVAREIFIEQKPGAVLPLRERFRDETGSLRELGAFYRDKPVLTVLVYYECPMLCGLVLNDVVRCLRALSFDVGKEFDVVVVSIDPGESPELARKKKASALEVYDRPGSADGWHFLVGEQEAIDKLASAVGFQYSYDPKTDQYAHAAGIQIVTPKGVVSRYFLGLEYSPRDVRLALIEAGDGTVGSVIDQVQFLCFQYDPTSGKYGLAVMRILRIGGILTVLGIASYLFIALRRESRENAASISLEGPA